MFLFFTLKLKAVMFFAQADFLHPRKWVSFLIESSSEICFLAKVARARLLSLPLSFSIRVSLDGKRTGIKE